MDARPSPRPGRPAVARRDRHPDLASALLHRARGGQRRPDQSVAPEQGGMTGSCQPRLQEPSPEGARRAVSPYRVLSKAGHAPRVPGTGGRLAGRSAARPGSGAPSFCPCQVHRRGVNAGWRRRCQTGSAARGARARHDCAPQPPVGEDGPGRYSLTGMTCA